MQSTHKNDRAENNRKTVKVLVGDDLRAFTVDRENLCKHSVYFQVALNGKFYEASTMTVVLNDIPPGIFKSFIDFVELGEFEVIKVSGLTRFEVLVATYVLGDRLDAQKFRNDICNCIYHELHLLPDLPLPAMAEALEIIPNCLPVTKLFTYMIAKHFCNGERDIIRTLFTPKFCTDVEAMTCSFYEKPYGLCQNCYEKAKDDEEVNEWALDNCEHFLDEVSISSAAFYREVAS